MSTKSAGLAKKIGYTNVQVMLKGAPGWKKAGHQLVASDAYIKTANVVLIDLRPASEVAKGHIARAVNVPMAELADAEDDFPSKKIASIVLYGNGNDAEQAATIIQKWGYKKISLVEGGVNGFTARGNTLETGPAAAEIKWVRTLGAGEVDIAEFKKALAGAPGQAVLDVRTNDEAAAGKFDNAIHIPLDEIEARIAELPKDKEILVHCTTGARAEMAWQALGKAGYKSRFLVADVECEGGACKIIDE